MEENYTTIDLEDIIKAEKKAKKREAFQNKIKSIGTWITNNKELVIVAIPVVAGAVTGATKLVKKTVVQRQAKDLKELYCYDPSLGHYWRLKRKLTNADWIKINARKNNGESLGTILDELKVLK